LINELLRALTLSKALYTGTVRGLFFRLMRKAKAIIWDGNSGFLPKGSSVPPFLLFCASAFLLQNRFLNTKKYRFKVIVYIFTKKSMIFCVIFFYKISKRYRNLFEYVV